MELPILDAVADDLARQVTALTGESMAEAVRVALAERLVRERTKHGVPGLADQIDAIVTRVQALPVLDQRDPDQILGYGERGLPA